MIWWVVVFSFSRKYVSNPVDWFVILFCRVEDWTCSYPPGAAFAGFSIICPGAGLIPGNPWAGERISSASSPQLVSVCLFQVKCCCLC